MADADEATRQAGAPFDETDANSSSRSAAGRQSAKPGFVLLEFEYQQTLRPCDVSDSEDVRALAVAFETIRVSRSAAPNATAEYPMSGHIPDELRLIYGFSHQESWGTWSDGRRSCLLLDIGPAGQDLILAIRHTVFDALGKGVRAKAWVNGMAIPDVVFEGGEVDIPVAADMIELPRAPLVPDTEAPELSIVIVNVNRWDLTIACVVAVIAARIRASFEIIVVDNGSDPASLSQLETAALPIRLIHLEDRRSFGEANNLGVEAARGRDLLLLDNDAFVVAPCLDRLSQTLATNAGIGAVGPVFSSPDGRVQEAGAFVAQSGATVRRQQPNATPVEEHAGPARVDYISAACLMMRRDTFLRLGGFDPVYEPAYHEDVDLCLRVQAIGLDVALVPDAACRQIAGATRSALVEDVPIAATERIFESRWRSWFWDKAVSRLSASPDFAFDDWQVRASRVPAEGACAFILTEPLAATRKTHSTIAAMAAASRAQPVVLASSTAYSGIRLLQLAELFSLNLGPIATGAMGDDRLRGATVSVLVSETLTPRPCDLPGRRILYCPSPRRAQWPSAGEGREIIQSLLGLDCIVTDSFFAREQIERFLRGIGASLPRIEVIHPPVLAAPASPVDRTRKQPIMLSLGCFSRGPSGGSHQAVLRAFKTFRSLSSRQGWRLVAVGDVSSGDDLGSIDDLQAAGADLGLDVILNPSRQQMRDLLTAARVVVVAQGLGMKARDRASCTMSGAEVATAIGFGCVPVVSAFGAAAETCETVGIGIRIGFEADMAQALEDGAVLAETSGVEPDHYRRLESVQMSAFEERWRRILSGDGPPREAGPGLSNPPETLVRETRRADPLGRALVVLGMHRSGTSAMARVLAFSGAELPRDLMPPQPDNPTGFWESRGIQDFNERVLRDLDLSWKDIFCFEPKSALADPYGEVLADAGAAVQDSFGGQSPIVLKDPRITLMLPLWNEALAREAYHPFYIVMVRDPWEVALSLMARDEGMPRSQALLVWANYLVAATRDSAAFDRLFVAYEDLLADPTGVLDRIESVSGHALPGRSMVADLEIEQFLRSDLRHHRRPQGAGLDDFPLIDRFYQTLLAAARGQQFDSAAMAEVEAWLTSLRQTVGPTFAALKAAGRSV